jgi:Domain of unknown function (DUF1905)
MQLFGLMPDQVDGILFLYYLTFQKKTSREKLNSEEEGRGKLKATVKTGKTAIWFDKKLKTYHLPLKADIRKMEQITAGETITIYIWF